MIIVANSSNPAYWRSLMTTATRVPEAKVRAPMAAINVLVQPEMEWGRFPLVSNPTPWGKVIVAPPRPSVSNFRFVRYSLFIRSLIE
jgi:hypothetical protein